MHKDLCRLLIERTEGHVIGGHEEGKTLSDPLPGSLSLPEESTSVYTHELWCITLSCTQGGR